MDSEDFLAHYGVKGMKWGKRKAPDAAKVAAKAGRKAERAKIGANLNKEFDPKTSAGKKRIGGTVAGTLLAGPAANIYMGAKIAQASGYSKGSSAVIGMVGGAPGALVVAEISARSNAKKR